MKWLGGILAGVVFPLLLSELTDWCPWFAKRLVQRAARHLPEDARARWEEEWLEHIDALASRRLSALVRAVWIYVRAPSWGRMLRGLPPISHVVIDRIKTLGKRLHRPGEPSVIHRDHIHVPSGSLWPWAFANYEDSERIRGLLTDRKASAFYLQESVFRTDEVEAVLYFPSATPYPTLGTVWTIRVRRRDLPALLYLVRRTQGLRPMSAERWLHSVGWRDLSKQVRRTDRTIKT